MEARDFRDFDHIGIFYCESTQEVRQLEKITMINNFNRGESVSPSYTPQSESISFTVSLTLCFSANFVPGQLTLTVNKGETVHLSMLLLGSEKRDVTWKYNGMFSETSGKKKG